MLRLDVISKGVVAFEMPATIQYSDAEDLDRALRLLAEGGCRAAIVDIGAVTYVSGDALRLLAGCTARTRDTNLQLVFVVEENATARRLLHDLRADNVYRTLDEATSSLVVKA